MIYTAFVVHCCEEKCDVWVQAQELAVMEAAKRRRLVDDVTCVCVLRKALLQVRASGGCHVGLCCDVAAAAAAAAAVISAAAANNDAEIRAGACEGGGGGGGGGDAYFACGGGGGGRWRRQASKRGGGSGGRGNGVNKINLPSRFTVRFPRQRLVQRHTGHMQTKHQRHTGHMSQRCVCSNSHAADAVPARRNSQPRPLNPNSCSCSIVCGATESHASDEAAVLFCRSRVGNKCILPCLGGVITLKFDCSKQSCALLLLPESEFKICVGLCSTKRLASIKFRTDAFTKLLMPGVNTREIRAWAINKNKLL